MMETSFVRSWAVTFGPIVLLATLVAEFTCVDRLDNVESACWSDKFAKFRLLVYCVFAEICWFSRMIPTVAAGSSLAMDNRCPDESCCDSVCRLAWSVCNWLTSIVLLIRFEVRPDNSGNIVMEIPSILTE